MNESPASATKEWDMVIRPKIGWLDLHLADLWRYRDLTAMFVWRDFVAQYKQTILGPLWHILQPLFTTLIFTVVFGKMAKLPTDGVPPLLFYLAGVTCWIVLCGLREPHVRHLYWQRGDLRQSLLSTA